MRNEEEREGGREGEKEGGREGERGREESREGEKEGGKKDKTKSNKNFISCWILSFFIVKYNLLCKKYLKKYSFIKKKRALNSGIRVHLLRRDLVYFV